MPEPLARLVERAYRLLRPLAAAILGGLNRACPSVVRDLFGSDIFHRNTSRYAWLANQFGHFCIGILFVGAGWLLGWIWAGGPAICPDCGKRPCCIAFDESTVRLIAIVTAFVLVLGYVMKEMADAVMELDDRRRDRGGEAAAEAGVTGKDPERLLRFTWTEAEIGADGLIDTGFVVLGVLTSIIILHLPPSPPMPGVLWSALIAAATLGTTVLWLAPGILRKKQAFDNSALPNFSRLHRFNGEVEAVSVRPGIASEASADWRRKVEELFEASSNKERFVVIVSAAKAVRGRTTLAIAIAWDVIQQMDRSARYTFWDDYRQIHSDDRTEDTVHPGMADILIVDNVQPSPAAVSDLVDRIDAAGVGTAGRDMVFVLQDDTADRMDLSLPGRRVLHLKVVGTPRVQPSNRRG